MYEVTKRFHTLAAHAWPAHSTSSYSTETSHLVKNTSCDICNIFPGPDRSLSVLTKAFPSETKKPIRSWSAQVTEPSSPETAAITYRCVHPLFASIHCVVSSVRDGLIDPLWSAGQKWLLAANPSLLVLCRR